MAILEICKAPGRALPPSLLLASIALFAALGTRIYAVFGIIRSMTTACSMLFFFRYLKAVSGAHGLIASYNAETCLAAIQHQAGSVSSMRVRI
ncbi:hypothetical protein DR64_7031 [Paraburkholderia xenovorans LB400]|uniref:Uncharacterized protein n=1 Tax=Paraburkholderia xenovorans (strain LB400) TaxID=266265 RepID=Q13NU7_PARXL|nr:hypothetical protein [Paraburkholderia xenovorans]ABE34242.1 hypothetical protein Bxe_B1724 [Paraburkholderia xenovorans LB400]AIP36080.1 hypothetical protein DR64_7031 [Paraburkholderia xenovorans LB400]